MTPRPDDDCESRTVDLIDFVYQLQAALKTLTEMLAMNRNNPISPVAWNHLAIGAYYLRQDVSKHVH